MCECVRERDRPTDRQRETEREMDREKEKVRGRIPGVYDAPCALPLEVDSRDVWENRARSESIHRNHVEVMPRHPFQVRFLQIASRGVAQLHHNVYNVALFKLFVHLR